MIGTKKNYSDLLKDPRWQKKRLQILERDDFTCQGCGGKENTLHVHHKEYVYGRMPWEYDDEELITYCEDCHAFIEWLIKDYCKYMPGGTKYTIEEKRKKKTIKKHNNYKILKIGDTFYTVQNNETIIIVEMDGNGAMYTYSKKFAKKIMEFFYKNITNGK